MTAPREHITLTRREVGGGRKSFGDVPRPLRTDAAGSSVIRHHVACLFAANGAERPDWGPRRPRRAEGGVDNSPLPPLTVFVCALRIPLSAT